jgi:MarR family transcriptional regulator for hemolysin
MKQPPVTPPIGLRLSRISRVVSQAFDRAMSEAGGSAAAWQVLLLVRSEQWGTQAKLAEAMGITQATLTHHLTSLEKQGLVRRWRDDANRRIQRVELTLRPPARRGRPSRPAPALQPHRRRDATAR